MSSIPIYYLLFVFLGCVLTIIAIWARRRLWIRLTALAILIALVGLNFSALTDLLGRPLPVQYAEHDVFEEDSVVLAASIDEGIAIYLWLRHAHQRQPYYYQMEWDQEAAVALKRAMDRSSRDNSSVMMRPEYESSLEGDKEPLFYALPPERLPLKPPPNVYEYRNPDNAVF